MSQEQQEPQREAPEGLTAKEILTRIRALHTPTAEIEQAVARALSEIERSLPGLDFRIEESPEIMQAMGELARALEQNLSTLELDLSAFQAALRPGFEVLMNHTKEELHGLIERLPDSEVMAAERYLEFLISREEAPVDPEMLKRIDAARAEPSVGIPHDEILREYGL